MSDTTADTNGQMDRTIQEKAFVVSMYLGLLAYILVLLNIAIGYSTENRLFPLLIGIPTAILITAYIGIYLYTGPTQKKDITAKLEDATESEELSFESEPESQLPSQVELIVTASSIAAVVLIYYIGFAYGLILYTLWFVNYFKKDWWLAVKVTLILAILAYILFVIVLGVRPYEGVLELPQPFYSWG